jgi:hypothetical protein
MALRPFHSKVQGHGVMAQSIVNALQKSCSAKPLHPVGAPPTISTPSRSYSAVTKACCPGLCSKAPTASPSTHALPPVHSSASSAEFPRHARTCHYWPLRISGTEPGGTFKWTDLAIADMKLRQMIRDMWWVKGSWTSRSRRMHSMVGGMLCVQIRRRGGSTRIIGRGCSSIERWPRDAAVLNLIYLRMTRERCGQIYLRLPQFASTSMG